MNQEFEQLIGRFIAQNGREILNNPLRCMGLLNDLARGEFQNEIRLFRQTIELGYHRNILGTNEPEITANFLINRLQDECFLSEEASYSIIALLFLVLRNYRVQKPAARPAVHPQKAVSPVKKGTGKTKGKITPEMIKQAYIYAKLVYNGNLTMDQAVNHLKNNFGMNPASALMYISNFKNFVDGKVLGRDMSQMAVEYYLEHIRQDYGNDRLRRAVHALGLRIKYMEDNDISAVKYRELYDKWNTR